MSGRVNESDRGAMSRKRVVWEGQGLLESGYARDTEQYRATEGRYRGQYLLYWPGRRAVRSLLSGARREVGWTGHDRRVAARASRRERKERRNS